MNRDVGKQRVTPRSPEGVVRIERALFTGFGGLSNLETRLRCTDLFGTLEISHDHLSIAGWWSPKYELQNGFIEKLNFREHRI